MFYFFITLYTEDWESHNTYFVQTDYSIMIYVSFLFLIIAILLLVVGIKNLIPEKIEVDGQGIKVTIGKKQKQASWSDIVELRNTRAWMGGTVTTPIIIIKTKNWKYKLRHSRFKNENLKELFNNMSIHVIHSGATIIDEEGWLPEHMSLYSKIALGSSIEMKIYQGLKKIGIMMLLIGGVSILFITIYPPILEISLSLLAFGFFSTFIGWIGVSDKLEKEKNRNKR